MPFKHGNTGSSPVGRTNRAERIRLLSTIVVTLNHETLRRLADTHGEDRDVRIDTVAFQFENLPERRMRVLELVEGEPSTVVYCIGKVFVVEMRLNPLELYHWRHVFEKNGVPYTHCIKEKKPTLP